MHRRTKPFAGFCLWLLLLFSMHSASAQTFQLTVTVNGNGNITASSSPTPISGSIQNCGSTGGSNCQAVYSSGQAVTLFATPDAGSEIDSWSGDAACIVAPNNLTQQLTVTMNQAQACTATFGLPQFNYYHGPLVSNEQIVPVLFWPSSIDPSVTANIHQFLSDISISSWYDLLSEYASVGGTNQSIGRGVVTASVSVGTGTPAAVVDDNSGNPTPLVAQLSSLISSGALPPPQQDGAGNTNTVYMLYFPAGTLVQSGGNSCTDFLGYHWSFRFGPTNILVPYAVIPSCPISPGYTATLLDEITDVSSHELAEMATDSDSGSGGWLDQIANEIADICDLTYGNPYIVNGHTWSVAPLWSKALSSCVMTGLNPNYVVSAPASAPTGLPFTFSVTTKNPAGNLGTDTAYVGTVHFTSTDPGAVLPADFTYIPEDQGAYGFTATLLSGTQTITATDTLNGKIVGTSGPISVSAGGSQCSGANNYTIPFFDDFPGSNLNPSRWTANANGGTIIVANNSVALSSLPPPGGSPFPYVTAVGSPIPPSGDFSVRWIAQYDSAQTAAGTETLALTQTLPTNGASSWVDVVDVWQDSTYRVQMQGAPIYSVASNVASHEVEVCWLAGTTEIYVDRTQVLAQARGSNVPRPTTLWFGNPSNSTNTWVPFTLNHVEVRALNDMIFRNGFGG